MKLMAPIFDFKTKQEVNVKSKSNWLACLINNDSTYRKEMASTVDSQNSSNRVHHMGSQQFSATQKLDKDEEDGMNSDEEENFFKGSVFHQYLKEIRQATKRPDKADAVINHGP